MTKQKIKRPKQSLIADLLQSRPTPSQDRNADTISVQKFFLIVCEGQKTEPNYFKAIRDELPEHLVNIAIHGKGYNTVSLVKSAISMMEQRKQDKLLPDYDKVYTVFDKDDFDNEIFNKAVNLADQYGILPAYSNEAFELWYVLHFQYLDAAITREEYQGILKRHLGKYEKNSEIIYYLLQEKGNESQAIKWADQLLIAKANGNPAKEKPTTRVHQLVRELNKFKRK